MGLTETVITLIFCHLVGDYVLQIDLLAKTKGTNYYHLFVHCLLYTLPFYICFGLDGRILVLFFTHIWIDSYKAIYHKISYTTDQIAHYIILIIYLL